MTGEGLPFPFPDNVPHPLLNREHGSYRRWVRVAQEPPGPRDTCASSGEHRGREPRPANLAQIESDVTFRWRVALVRPDGSFRTQEVPAAQPSLFFLSWLLVPAAAIRNPGIATRILGQALHFLLTPCLLVSTFVLFSDPFCSVELIINFDRTYYRF
jgi:hypothetical protein